MKTLLKVMLVVLTALEVGWGAGKGGEAKLGTVLQAEGCEGRGRHHERMEADPIQSTASIQDQFNALTASDRALYNMQPAPRWVPAAFGVPAYAWIHGCVTGECFGATYDATGILLSATAAPISYLLRIPETYGASDIRRLWVIPPGGIQTELVTLFGLIDLLLSQGDAVAMVNSLYVKFLGPSYPGNPLFLRLASDLNLGAAFVRDFMAAKLTAPDRIYGQGGSRGALDISGASADPETPLDGAVLGVTGSWKGLVTRVPSVLRRPVPVIPETGIPIRSEVAQGLARISLPLVLGDLDPSYQGSVLDYDLSSRPEAVRERFDQPGVRPGIPVIPTIKVDALLDENVWPASQLDHVQRILSADGSDLVRWYENQNMEHGGWNTPASLAGRVRQNTFAAMKLLEAWVEDCREPGTWHTTVGSVKSSNQLGFDEDPQGYFDAMKSLINVVDNAPPNMTLNGANPLRLPLHAAFSDPGATAVDGTGGPLTVTDVTGAVDVDTPGEYVRVYRVSDTHGNANTAIRTIIVGDPASRDPD